MRAIVDVVTDFAKNRCQHRPRDAARVHVETTRVEARDETKTIVYVDRRSMFEGLPDVYDSRHACVRHCTERDDASIGPDSSRPQRVDIVSQVRATTGELGTGGTILRR